MIFTLKIYFILNMTSEKYLNYDKSVIIEIKKNFYRNSIQNYSKY